MKKRMIEVVCPFCAHTFWMLRDTMILMDESSVEHKRLMESGFFWHQCQRCRRLFELNYPFLVRDSKRNLSLLLLPEGNLPEGEKGTLIRMKTPADFQYAYQAAALNLPFGEAAAASRLLKRRGYIRLRLESAGEKELVIAADDQLIRLKRDSVLR